MISSTNQEYIKVCDLNFCYRGEENKNALSSINLSVGSGRIFGFLGPNGAGKTTLIKIICGIIPGFDKAVRVMGFGPSAPESRKKIGYMPEIAQYYWYLTPRELLWMYGRIFNIPKKNLKIKIDELLDLVELSNVQNRLIRTFSKGMLQRVSFAQALINDPQLLILDEPTSGLDPLSRIKMRDVILSLRDQGKTIFFSSHELSEVETICDEVSIIKDGQVLASGKLSELLGREQGPQSLEQYFLKVIA